MPSDVATSYDNVRRCAALLYFRSIRSFRWWVVHSESSVQLRPPRNKQSILIVQRLAIHQNGVEFGQQFNGAIRTSLIAPYNYSRRDPNGPNGHKMVKIEKCLFSLKKWFHNLLMIVHLLSLKNIYNFRPRNIEHANTSNESMKIMILSKIAQ